MAAGTSGAKGSISKRDFGAPQRRYRVMYTLLMQGAMVVILLLLAWLSRDDRRMLLLDLVTLVVPLGWAYAVYTAWRRDEAARREKRFDAAFAAAERKRALSIMGVALAVWAALLAAVFVLT